jgi:multidrug efflux system outer membrane protein
MKNKYILYIICLPVLVMTSCKTPQGTTITDRVKAQMPSHFQSDSTSAGAATVTPWRQFFTDPALVALIDTAHWLTTKTLRMTLQQIAIAKSGVLLSRRTADANGICRR